MDADPFAILGLERRFDLTARQVRDAWRSLAAVQHPDVSGEDNSLHGVTRDAAQLNAAKHVLLDAEQRADALVVLMGGPSREQEKSLPVDFLTEMMDVRESFEEAIAESDQKQIAYWASWAQDQWVGVLSVVEEMFNCMGESPDAPVLRAVRLELNRLRYVGRMRERVSEVEEGIG